MKTFHEGEESSSDDKDERNNNECDDPRREEGGEGSGSENDFDDEEEGDESENDDDEEDTSESEGEDDEETRAAWIRSHTQPRTTATHVLYGSSNNTSRSQQPHVALSASCSSHTNARSAVTADAVSSSFSSRAGNSSVWPPAPSYTRVAAAISGPFPSPLLSCPPPTSLSSFPPSSSNAFSSSQTAVTADSVGSSGISSIYGSHQHTNNNTNSNNNGCWTLTCGRKAVTTRETFLMFVKILLLAIDVAEGEKAPLIKNKAKACIAECTRRNRQGDPLFMPLQDVCEAKLQLCVSNTCWSRALGLFDRFLKRHQLHVVENFQSVQAV